MEIKNKELRSASYHMTCESGDYLIKGNVTIGTDDKVTSMDSCQITKDGMNIASFGYYGANLNINFASNVELEEQSAVLTLIEDFKNNINN